MIFTSLRLTVTPLLPLSLFVFCQQLAAEDAPGQNMSVAASGYLQALTDEQRQATTFGFDDAERVNWHFIPRERKGLGLWDLEGRGLTAAEALVATGLTEAGYRKSLEVRSLEEVLYLFEGGDEATRRKRRHPHKYYISVFGDPAGDAVWGWRFEGHHLSLNYTVQGGQILSATPEFFGANPGLIEGGPGRSLRVLGRREDLARDILKAATTDQQSAIWISKEAPHDIRGAGAAQAEVSEPQGVAAGDMNPEQQELLRELVGEYLSTMPASVVSRRLTEIRAAGLEQIHFAWWGGSELNEPHHYVIQGPTFVIEYNNTQNQANHVHSIWRNLNGDFNLPR